MTDDVTTNPLVRVVPEYQARVDKLESAIGSACHADTTARNLKIAALSDDLASANERIAELEWENRDLRDGLASTVRELQRLRNSMDGEATVDPCENFTDDDLEALLCKAEARQPGPLDRLTAEEAEALQKQQLDLAAQLQNDAEKPLATGVIPCRCSCGLRFAGEQNTEG